MYQALIPPARPVLPPSVRTALRAATNGDHERLDTMFGGFDLADRGGYIGFLRAHARALPTIETAIAASGDIAGWRPRAPLIRADLAELGEAMPPALPISLPCGPRLWGGRYVVEGSRLGGALLARSVGAGLPRAYLGARHGAGEWRAFLDTLEHASKGAAWRDEAIEGARLAFALFATAATREMTDHG